MFTIFKQTWIVVLGLICCFQAKDISAEDRPSAIEFLVQPRLCVLSVSEKICQDDINVKWQAETMYSLCLYTDENTTPLHCWQDAWQGNHEVFIETSQAIAFFLKNTESSQILASQIFEVIQDAQRYRRRRRNPWSFF